MSNSLASYLSIYYTGGTGNYQSASSIGGVPSEVRFFEVGRGAPSNAPFTASQDSLPIDFYSSAEGQVTIADGKLNASFTLDGETVNSQEIDSPAAGESYVLFYQAPALGTVTLNIKEDADPLPDGTDALGYVPSLNDLFGPVLQKQVETGRTEYRCLWVQNDHPDKTLNVTPYCPAPSAGSQPDAGIAMSIDINGQGPKDTSVTEVTGDRFTSPDTLVWVDSGTSPSNWPVMESLLPGNGFGVWVRRTVAPGSSFAEGTVRQLRIGFRVEEEVIEP